MNIEDQLRSLLIHFDTGVLTEPEVKARTVLALSEATPNDIILFLGACIEVNPSDLRGGAA
jgi:hypothetical protein